MEPLKKEESRKDQKIKSTPNPAPLSVQTLTPFEA